MDDRGCLLEANDRALAAYGYSRRELLGLRIRDLLDPSEYATFDGRWQNLEEQGAEVFEGRHRRSDGSSFPVEVSSRRFESAGRILTHSVIRDISERKRAEEQVRRVTRAMQVLSASNQAVVRPGDEARLYHDICEAITGKGGYRLAWVGLAQEDDARSVRTVAAMGEHVHYLNDHGITWGEGPGGFGPVGKCIRTGKMVVCNDAEHDPAFEPWRARAAQHGFRSLTALPLRCESQVIGALAIYAGEPDAFYAAELGLLEELAGDLAFGIEARRRRIAQLRAEEALRQSAVEFQTLFNTANDIILIVDLYGRVLEANEAACRRLGYTREDLLRLTIAELDTPEYVALLPRRMAELTVHGELVCETVYRRRDGSELPLELNCRLFDYRQAQCTLVVARDISERKRAELDSRKRSAELERAKTEAEADSQAKSQFLANMSHEIRTPMNVICGMSGLLLDTTLAPAQREYADAIRRSSDALLSIVNDVLALSQIEAGSVKVEPVPFVVAECLEQVVDLMAPRAGAKGIDLEFRNSVEWRTIHADAGRIRQIVVQLVSNAIKFTERGGVVVRASLEPAEAGSAHLRVEVADTGIGIAADHLAAVFGKFTQVDSSLSKGYQGSGLGLAIARQLAGLMGGTLTVTSELGRGSTFILHLPVGVPAEKCASRPVAGAGNGASAGLRARSRRILLAEDNIVNQKIGSALLERLGCRVDVAANGREAVEMARQFPYDLILMDCGMPEMDGFAATQGIRLEEEGNGRVPIVALTAHAVDGMREQCLNAGMDDYITKPVTPANLERVLAQWSP